MEQSIHYPLGLALKRRRRQGLNETMRAFALVNHVAQSECLDLRLALAARMPRFVVMHGSPQVEVIAMRSYCDEMSKITNLVTLACPKAHQPQTRQPIPGSFHLTYASAAPFSIASKDIVLEAIVPRLV
jgi:hypothetical protein